MAFLFFVFLEFSCFFCEPTACYNFISGTSTFSKSNLIIWKFSVHGLLKPSLANFEYYFASLGNVCSLWYLNILWHCFSFYKIIEYYSDPFSFGTLMLWFLHYLRLAVRRNLSLMSIRYLFSDF